MMGMAYIVCSHVTTHINRNSKLLKKAPKPGKQHQGYVLALFLGKVSVSLGDFPWT